MRAIFLCLALLTVGCAAEPVNAPDSGKHGKPEKYLHFQLLCLKRPDLPGCEAPGDDR